MNSFTELKHSKVRFTHSASAHKALERMNLTRSWVGGDEIDPESDIFRKVAGR